MRKFFGTVLILGGFLSLADILIWGTLNAGVAGAKAHLLLPLLAPDPEYPTAVTKLCFGLGLFFIGLYLLLLEGDMGRSPLAGLFMLNALGLCFSLIVAFVAAQNQGREAMVGIATAAAGLHLLCGLVLLYFASTERPVGAAGLSLGSVIYVASAAVGAVVYLSGKA